MVKRAYKPKMSFDEKSVEYFSKFTRYIDIILKITNMSILNFNNENVNIILRLERVMELPKCKNV